MIFGDVAAGVAREDDEDDGETTLLLVPLTGVDALGGPDDCCPAGASRLADSPSGVCGSGLGDLPRVDRTGAGRRRVPVFDSMEGPWAA